MEKLCPLLSPGRAIVRSDDGLSDDNLVEGGRFGQAIALVLRWLFELELW
jgi:hypothetical protein